MSVVGFDLGNQSCFVAVARQGGIETIDNEYSDRNTPACLAFNDKERLAGIAAKNQSTTNVANTLVGFRRLIAAEFDSPSTQTELKHSSFNTVSSKGKLGIQVQYLGESQMFTPVQLTAMMLVKLKTIAEARLSNKVTDCVVSVPQYYTDAERRALLLATKIAGVNCLRLFNDTTATALAYGIYKQDLPGPEEKSRNVVFVDMGQSDLQVAFVAFNKAKLKVIHTASDPNLGGRDFDRVLLCHFIEEFDTKFRIKTRSHPRYVLRLATECEKLKKLMSANVNALPLNIECFVNDVDVSGRMSRSEFEGLCEGLLSRVERVLADGLATSGLAVGDIHSVEIVGGSTRIPAVKQIISRVFQHPPSTTLNTDESVARGCALQCAVLSPTFLVREFSVRDVAHYPVTLRWGSAESDGGGDMEIFSERHEVPCTSMLTFFRRKPFDIFACYSFPNAIPYHSANIGKFTVNNVVPQPNGESSKVKVKVRINLHGVFNVDSAQLVEKPEAEPVVEEVDTVMDEAVDGVDKNVDESDKASDSIDNSPEENVADKGDLENHVDVPMDADKVDAKVNGSPKKAGNNSQSESKSPGGKPKEKPKKKKSKYIDLGVTATTSFSIDDSVLNQLVERELQIQSNNRLERERADAKNSVEEYVYGMRDKLGDKFAEFIKQTDKEVFMGRLEATENWLYEDGEDCAKQVYVDKLDELKRVGDPVGSRYREYQLRPRAFEDLGQACQRYRKFVDRFNSEDAELSHVDKEEAAKVEKAVEESAQWMHNHLQSFANAAMYDDPCVTYSEIGTHTRSLVSRCDPVVNKPKPKPVEPPPPPPEQPVAEDNADSKENGVTEEKVDDKPNDMDLD